MSIETTIRAALSTSLGANVNGVSVGRLHEDYALPWVTFTRIDTPRRQALGVGSPVISSKPRFQFILWATTFVAADPVRTLLTAALLALPYAVTLSNDHGSEDPETGWWREFVDAKVNHAGA